MLAVSMNGTAGPWTYAEETKAPAETSADASAVNDAENNTADTKDTIVSDTDAVSTGTDDVNSENTVNDGETSNSDDSVDAPSDVNGGNTDSETGSLSDNVAEIDGAVSASQAQKAQASFSSVSLMGKTATASNTVTYRDYGNVVINGFHGETGTRTDGYDFELILSQRDWNLSRTAGVSFAVPTAEENVPAECLPNGYYWDGRIWGQQYHTMINGQTKTQPEYRLWMNYYASVKTYTITYNLNGGTNNDENPDTYNILYGVSLKPATKDGYYFVGWTTDEAGTDFVTGINEGKDAVFTDGSENFSESVLFSELASRETGNVALYAQWAAPGTMYTLALDPNGGKFSGTQGTPCVISPYDKEHSLALGESYYWSVDFLDAIKAGYTFDGWYSEPDGGEKVYDQEGHCIEGTYWDINNRYQYPHDLTVYAHYVPNDYTILFDPNGGTGAMSNETITYDTEQALTGNTYTRTRYTFKGWNTAADGSGVAYADGEVIKNLAESGTVTLYAQWTANRYTITWDANGGTGGGESGYSYPYFDSVDFWIQSYPSRKYYSLLGMYDSDGNQVYAYSYMSAESLAKWKQSNAAGWYCTAVKGKYWSDNDGNATWIYPGDVTAIAKWQRNTGNLTISETTTGNFGSKDKSFPVTITLTDPVDSTGSDLSAWASANGATYSNGTATLTLNLSGSNSKTLTIPSGCTYTVSQAEAQYYTTSIENASGTIPDNSGAVTATVTNTLGKADLTVSKSVSGNFGSKDRYFKFIVDLKNLGVDETYSLDLSNASEKTTTNNGTNTVQTNPATFTTDANGNATVTVWLKHGESIVFKDLYESCTYNITEDPENYTASSKITAN